jgi:hypothetical protein
VYDFLERFCGVRWLSPTEMDCPKSRTLVASGSDIRRKPFFCYRDAFARYPSVRYDSYTALWPAESEGFKKWEAEAYRELHTKYPNANQYRAAKTVANRLFLLRMRDGGEVCGCNHSLYGYYDRFWEKNPKDPDAFVEKHADWFAQGYEGKPPQMCYTSPGLIKQLAQDARDYYDGKKTGKDLRIFWQPELPNPVPVEPMDNRSYCKCPRCQALLKPKQERTIYSTGEHSDYFFNFVNEVAKEVKKTHPGKPLVTLAYSSHALPPERFQLDPSVIVQFCFAHNRMPYGRVQYEAEVKALEAWAAQGRPLYLWLYYTFPVEIANNGKFHCVPGFFAHTIGEQMKLFHKLRVRGMFHCGYGQEVEAYVTFKLMDDPTLDVDALLEDYFGRLYGTAAAPMKKLYLAIEEIYCNPSNYPERPGHENFLIAWGRLGTEQRMAELASLMQQAKEMAKTDQEKRRVALFELGTWNYMLEGRGQYAARLASPIPAVKATRVDAAKGDAGKVQWDKAAVLGGSWYDRGQDKPAARRLSGRVAHDGEFLYLELTDPCDPKKLATSAMVFPYDDWEIFIAGQRGTPYRQYAVGPTGSMAALSHGEVNFQRNVPLEGHGIKAASDVSAADKWVTRLAMPLASVVPGGVAPGGKLYMNIIRVSCPQLAGGGRLGIDTWVSFCTVHEVDRLAEIVLEK